jgi:hypothetical protein
MSNQELEVYAAAFATYDGLYTRLRTQAELLREGADNISVIKTLLDMTIPKDPTSCSIAGALQYLANGREPAALLQSLFKERRACLLLLLNGEAAAKALMVEDLVEINKGTEGYTITRLVDGGRSRMPAKSGHGGHNNRTSGHSNRTGARGGGSFRAMRENTAMGGHDSYQGGTRGGYGANHYRGRGNRTTKGDARTHNRTYGAPDHAPFPMSPEMAEDIIEKFVKESAVEEFPLPSRSPSYSAVLSVSSESGRMPVATTPSAAAAMPASDKPAATVPAADKPAADKPAAVPASDKPTANTPASDKPAAVPASAVPASDKPAATTPVTITVRKGRGKATAAVPSTPMAPSSVVTAAPQKINWSDINDEELFSNP